MTLSDHRRTPAFGNAGWEHDLQERHFPALAQLAAYVEMQVGSRRLLPPASDKVSHPGASQPGE
jgi:hypothetical protein